MVKPPVDGSRPGAYRPNFMAGILSPPVIRGKDAVPYGEMMIHG